MNKLGNLMFTASKTIEDFKKENNKLREKIIDMRMLIIDLQASLRTCANTSNSMIERCDDERKRLDL